MSLDVSEVQTIEHDVIVVGAGGAGLRAAIECSRQGLDTGIVCKSLLGKAHTVMAEGGAAAALGHVDPRDDWKVHFRDTIRGGKFLNSLRMAELHAQQAPDRIRELEAWGAVFDRTKKGHIKQRNFGGHRYPRLAHVGDRTGLELIRTLQDKGVHSGISVHMECTGVRFLKDGDRVSGMVAIWKETGRFVIFKAKAIILATGGAGKAWRITSNSWEYTADGHAMAYDVGAEFLDAEFTQFHPTGMVWPMSVKGILVTEGVRGEGGILLNNKGERFMFNYIPERFASETADSIEEADRWQSGDMTARRPPELLTRDVVARAISQEVAAGRGSEHGGAYLDIASRRTAEDIKKALPSMYHQFKELAEVDITKQPMEVGPTLHYLMGGIRVDPDSQMTKVAGLFACGECAAGLHGANRLGGNSLSDLLVFGRLAGIGAKSYIDELSSDLQIDEDQAKAGIRYATSFLNREEGPNPYVIHDELRDLMTEYVGIYRTKDQLEVGIDKLKDMKARAATVKAHGSSQYNPGWSECMDLQNMLVYAEAVARGAHLREESRGAHTRVDFEGEREEWSKYNIACRKAADGSMEIDKIERQVSNPDLERIARAEIDVLEAEVSKDRGV
jgi:succinate dehydrogenase / fumarate reductase, flavoprotein subunit